MTLKKYTLVYFSLLALLAATFELAYIDLARFNTAVGLAIAVSKALLVVLFFMHLKMSNGVTRIAAMAGAFWLGILLTLALADYLSRGWIRLPGVWPSIWP